MLGLPPRKVRLISKFQLYSITELYKNSVNKGEIINMFASCYISEYVLEGKDCFSLKIAVFFILIIRM